MSMERAVALERLVEIGGVLAAVAKREHELRHEAIDLIREHDVSEDEQ
jgi:hypothetical protein